MVILFIFPLSLFSQTDIGQIRNNSDVVNFIRKVGPEYFPWYKENPLPNVTFNVYGESFIYREKLSKQDGRFTDSATARKWFLVDFDGDQLQDLAYYGRIHYEVGIFVFFGGTTRRVINLADRHSSRFPHSIEPYKIGGANCIIAGTTKWPERGEKKNKPYSERFYHDTLVYKFGGFAEYNDNVKRGPAFDSVDFYISPGMGWGEDSWYLRLYKDGSINYVRSFDSTGKTITSHNIVEKKTAAINAQEVKDILDYIRFDELPEDFYLHYVTDLASACIIVYYSNGQKKKIEDYGSIGSHGLQTLYAKMYSYIENSSWRLVERVKGSVMLNHVYREK